MVQQLIELLQSARPIREVICLSPYHHTEAEPLIALATGLGAKALGLGLDPHEPVQPFDPRGLKGAGTSPRYLLAGDTETRPLHAKLYEFRGAQPYVLSGSVNATNASLASTANVEAAILRRLEHGAEIQWIETVPKPIKRPVPREGQSAQWFALTGTVAIDGDVHGRIWGVEQPTGEWRGTIELRLSFIKLGAVSVTSDGSFNFARPRCWRTL